MLTLRAAGFMLGGFLLGFSSSYLFMRRASSPHDSLQRLDDEDDSQSPINDDHLMFPSDGIKDASPSNIIEYVPLSTEVRHNMKIENCGYLYALNSASKKEPITVKGSAICHYGIGRGPECCLVIKNYSTEGTFVNGLCIGQNEKTPPSDTNETAVLEPTKFTFRLPSAQNNENEYVIVQAVRSNDRPIGRAHEGEDQLFTPSHLLANVPNIRDWCQILPQAPQDAPSVEAKGHVWGSLVPLDLKASSLHPNLDDEPFTLKEHDANPSGCSQGQCQIPHIPPPCPIFRGPFQNWQASGGCPNKKRDQDNADIIDNPSPKRSKPEAPLARNASVPIFPPRIFRPKTRKRFTAYA